MARVANKSACEAFLNQKREACERRTKLFEDELFRIMSIIGGNREGLSDEEQAVAQEEWFKRGNTVLAKSMFPMGSLNQSDKDKVSPENLYV